MAAHFRLATVLRLRERERDQAAGEVEQVHRAIAIVDGRIEELQSEYRQMDDFRQDASIGAISIHRLLDVQRYQLVLTGQIQHAKQQREQLLVELRKREAKLTAIQQKVKVLEKLKEKHLEDDRILQQARQQARIDEWSSIREARIRIQDGISSSNGSS